jgi:hypothetical protein
MKNLKNQYPVILFCVLYLIFIPFYLYQAGSDTVSYIAIAENYLAGNWSLAMNGYWSPLFSFMLMPFVALHIEPLMGVKIIGLASSILIFYSFKKLADIFMLKKEDTVIATYFLVPLLLWCSFSNTCPDVMATSILLFFLTKLFQTSYTPKDLVLIPLLGFVCYLGKYYNIYFIILAFIGRAVFIKNEYRIKELAITLGLYLAICSIWLFCIYNKYDKFTPTTATNYNLYINGPELFLEIKKAQETTGRTPTVRKCPAERGNLMSYLDYGKYRYTSWEDPSYYQGTWSPFKSAWDMKFYFTNIIWVNFMDMLSMLVVYFAAFILLLMLYRKKLIETFNGKTLLILLMAAVYPAGYILTHFEGRYVFFSEFLIVFLLMYIAANLPVKNRKLIVTGTFLVLSVFYSYQLITHMKNKGVETSKIAATKINNYVDGSVLYCTPYIWYRTLYVSYFNKKIKFHDSLKNVHDAPEKKFLLVCKTTEVGEIQSEFPQSQTVYVSRDFVVMNITK